MLISIETYRTCDFQGGGGGGVRTPYHPSGSLHAVELSNAEFILLISEQLNFHTQLS